MKVAAQSGLWKQAHAARVEIFVTGATGFIGRHLLGTLAGHSVTALARSDTRLPGVRVVKGVLGANSIPVPKGAAVVHMAAMSAPQEVEADPELAARVNVMGTLRLLEAARRADASRFVFLSSSYVYGVPRTERVDEDHPLQPVNLYGATKAAGEALVSSYSALYGLATVALRPFNVYGPGQRSGFILPTILEQLREGDRVALASLSPVRDFVFVEDAVDAIARTLDRPEAAGGIFNLGCGTGVSIRVLAETAARVAGRRARIEEIGKPRPDRVPRLVAHPSRAGRALGWRAVTSLEDGLKRTLAAMP